MTMTDRSRLLRLLMFLRSHPFPDRPFPAFPDTRPVHADVAPLTFAEMMAVVDAREARRLARQRRRLRVVP